MHYFSIDLIMNDLHMYSYEVNYTYTIHIRENVSSVFSIEIESFSFVYQYFAIIDIE